MNVPTVKKPIFVNNRRAFLQQAGIFGAALLAAPAFACIPKRRNVGIQLYSLRDMIPNNVDKTLAELSEIGYTEVETFDYNTSKGYWGYSPKDFLTLLRNHGLTAPSGHYDSGKMLKDGNTEDLKKQIEAALTIHSKYVTIPSINNGYRTNADDLKRLAERMNTAGTLCAAAGIRLGYHNHDFEFKKYGEQTGYDILLQGTDPALVHFEMDIYWVTHGGYDPIAFFKKYPGRFPLWHVKDMSKKNRDDNTEIGSGTIDYVPIFKEAKTAGLEHFFVEQETNYKENPMHAAEISCHFIKKTLI